MEMSGQLHAPAALLSRENLQYPLDRRPDGSQSLSGRGGGKEKKIPAPVGN